MNLHHGYEHLTRKDIGPTQLTGTDARDHANLRIHLLLNQKRLVSRTMSATLLVIFCRNGVLLLLQDMSSQF